MQEKLQNIVKKWETKEKPEYRIYRCANCQTSIRKASQYLLNNKNFVVTVHLCKKCNNFLIFPKIKIKDFKCDACSKSVFKSWHIWSNKNNQKTEKHLCKNCFVSI